MVVPCMALGAAPGDAHDAHDAMQILARTAAAYANLRSYEFRVTVETIQGSNVGERRLTETGSRPANYRIQDEDPRGDLQVGDGRMEWIFNPQSNEYTKAPLTAETVTPISDLEHINQHVKKATLAREERFMVNGQPVPIYVVQVVRDRWPRGSLPGAEFAMYRIDQKTFAVHKAITYAKGTTQIVLYSIVKWNEAVPETLFAFTPPESAHATSSVAAGTALSTAMVGSEAPDFTLPDTAGKPVNLRGLRGSVVIVDFWATWCPPCRAMMPHLQQMHRTLADQGLVILGLDVGEDAETVAKFAKRESYTFPLLLGAEPDVAAKYYVESYPTTFVIDRQGRIAFRNMGGGPADGLQSAVESALHTGP
jgi:peroxiredoxin/outer membrane lipoprotein-sorting protein